MSAVGSPSSQLAEPLTPRSRWSTPGIEMGPLSGEMLIRRLKGGETRRRTFFFNRR